MRTLGKLHMVYSSKRYQETRRAFYSDKALRHTTMSLWTKGLPILFLLTPYPIIPLLWFWRHFKDAGPKGGCTYSISFCLPHFFPCALSLSFIFFPLSCYSSLAFDRKMSNLSISLQLCSFPDHVPSSFSFLCSREKSQIHLLSFKMATLISILELSPLCNLSW